MARRSHPSTPPPMNATHMLRDLVQAQAVLPRLAVRGQPEYRLLLDALQGQDITKRPTAAAVQQQRGITAAKYRRWLEHCYTDFLALLAADATALPVPDVVHCLYVPRREGVENITVQCRLPVTPRRGEEVELPFVRAAADQTVFYVHQVAYEWSGTALLVHVSLTADRLTNYERHLLERARFEGRLTLQQERELSTYQLLTHLKEVYR